MSVSIGSIFEQLIMPLLCLTFTVFFQISSFFKWQKRQPYLLKSKVSWVIHQYGKNEIPIQQMRDVQKACVFLGGAVFIRELYLASNLLLHPPCLSSCSFDEYILSARHFMELTSSGLAGAFFIFALRSASHTAFAINAGSLDDVDDDDDVNRPIPLLNTSSSGSSSCELVKYFPDELKSLVQCNDSTSAKLVMENLPPALLFSVISIKKSFMAFMMAIHMTYFSCLCITWSLNQYALLIATLPYAFVIYRLHADDIFEKQEVECKCEDKCE